YASQRYEHDNAQVRDREPHRYPEAGKYAFLLGTFHVKSAPFKHLCLCTRRIDLIEDAAIREMLLLRDAPAAKITVDLEQFKRLVLIGILLGYSRERRTEEMLAGQILTF